MGNYNVLLQPATPDLWDNEKISSRLSHEIFHNAFPAFAWEVLKVSVGPPEVHFEWRHFERFTGFKAKAETRHLVDGRRRFHASSPPAPARRRACR